MLVGAGLAALGAWRLATQFKFLATGQATMADPECSQLLLGGCPQLPTLTQVMSMVNVEAELIGVG